MRQKINLSMRRRRSSLLDESDSDSTSNSDLLSPAPSPTPTQMPTGASQDDTGFDPWDAPYLPQQNQKDRVVYGDSSPVIEWIVASQSQTPHRRDQTPPPPPALEPLSPTQSLTPSPSQAIEPNTSNTSDPRSFRCGQPQCSDPPSATPAEQTYAFSSPSPPPPPPIIDYYDEDTRAAPIDTPPSPTFRSRPLPFPRFVDPSDEDTTSDSSSDGSNDDRDEWRLERKMLRRDPIVIRPRTRPAAWLQRR